MEDTEERSKVMSNSNSSKIILHLCAGSGSDTQPYKDAGYDVRLVTKDIGVEYYTPPPNVYGIIANPPCTMFSLARTRAKTPRDFREGMKLVQHCLNIIWQCRYEPLYRKDNCLKFWALENPTGFLRQFLGRPVMTYHPYEYGHPYTKSTDIWGYFNEPKKNPIKLSLDDQEKCKNNNRRLPSISEFTGSKQAEQRAVCPQGFAQAFFNANK